MNHVAERVATRETEGRRVAAAGRLVARVEHVSNLGARQVEAMWRIFASYYADVDAQQFRRDLGAKQDVILLFDAGDGSIKGFSTLHVYDRVLDGQRVVAVFSGDTIIERGYWGQTALQRAFVLYVAKQKLANPFVPVYWFLITKGFKTYLLLQRNFPEHWPRYERPTPPHEQRILDELARDRFGDAYVPERGILRFPDRRGCLLPNVAPIDASALSDPAIRFFAEKNPGAPDGDELVCIGRVDAAFCVYFTARQVRRAFSRDRRAKLVK